MPIDIGLIEARLEADPGVAGGGIMNRPSAPIPFARVANERRQHRLSADDLAKRATSLQEALLLQNRHGFPPP